MSLSSVRSGSRRPLLIAVALTLSLALLAASGGQSESLDDAEAVAAVTSGALKVRHWFRFPALFDFTTYQILYTKSYRSAMERSARFGLFLARKHRVFISAVKYQHCKTNYFLGLNARSDWTHAELDSLQNNLVEPQAPIQATGADQPNELAAADNHSANFAGIQSDPDYKPLDALTILRDVSRHYGLLPNRGVAAAAAAAAQSNSHRARLTRLTKSLSGKILGKVMMSRRGKGESRAVELANQHEEEEEQEDALWVDHRRSGCLAEVQDQGLCGACYIFASLAYLEWAHCRETGNLIKFSEQYLVDCGSSRVRGLHGCAHGLVTQVGVFVNNFGLETAHGYGRDYAAHQARCPYTPDAPLATMGSVRLDMDSLVRVPLEHIEEILEDAPLVVNIGTSRELHEYGGGVYDGRGCSQTGHHSVLLIGHGRENGEEYWLLRNSESASYGEAGHLRLNKNSDCITPQMGFMFGRYTEGRVRILPSENLARQEPQHDMT